MSDRMKTVVVAMLVACGVLAVICNDTPPRIAVEFTLHDGTTVHSEGDWTVYRYPDGWECRWRPAVQDSARCVDENGIPQKLGGVK